MTRWPYWVATCPRCKRETYPLAHPEGPVALELGQEWTSCYGPTFPDNEAHVFTMRILVELVPTGGHPTTDWTARHARALIFAAINSEK